MSNSELAAELERHQLSVPAEMVEKLDAYCRLLWQWNERLNLTRHLDYPTFVARDLVDTLQLSEQIHRGEYVLDVGSGGGVPGVPLAILRPDVTVTLAEGTKKKAAALLDMVEKLGLDVSVRPQRVEELLSEFRCDTLVARAVGPMVRFLQWVEPHWGAFRRILLIKGPRWVEERKEARHYGRLQGLQLRRLASYQTPGRESENVILGIWADPHSTQETPRP